MKFFKSLLILPVLMIGMAAPALGQAANVGVFNEQRVMRESAVGQHIGTRLQAIAQEIDAELAAINQPIQQSIEQFNAETASMTPEAVQARPDLVQRGQALNQQIQQLELTRRARQQEYAATERQAWRPVYEALQPILEEVVEARGLDVLVDRSALVYSNARVDISPDVITRLDQRLPSVPVNRVRLPQDAVAGQDGQQ